MVLEKIEVQATFEDEITSRVQNALDTMVEFGASTDQVALAFANLTKAQKTGAKGMAQQANVLRTLVDESENADFALRNVAKATELAAQAGLKLEDAGRQLGQAFRGETTVLQNFDAAAKRAASAIDDITDPALRAKAIIIELNAATRRQNSIFGKLSNQLKLVSAVAPNFTRGIKALAVAFTGAGAAVTAFAAKSLKTYIEGSAKMRRANKRMEKSLKDLQFTFGAIIAQAIGIGDGFKGANSQIVSLTKTLKENRVPIVKTIQNIALASVVAARAITTPIKGLLLLFKATQDVFTEVAKGASVVLEGALTAFIALSKLKGKFKPLVGVELENVQRAQEALAQLKETRIKVEPFEGTTELVNDLDKVGEAFDRLEERFKKFDKDFKIDIPTPPGAKPPETLPTAADALALAPIGDADIPSLVGELAKEDGLGARFRKGIRQGTEDTRTLTDVMLGAKDASEDLSQSIDRNLSQVFQNFATGSLQMATDGLGSLFENLAAGESAFAGLGQALMNSLSSLLSQAGQAFILLGTGIENIKTGILAPGALIAIGIGMVALGGALKGFAKGQQGAEAGAGGSTAAALERFGRRIFDRGDADQGREVTINIEGRSMRGFVLDVAADGARRGSVPLTPRRA
tara:strand:- start:31 stop:1935 length:1905 start_codon:yes stop_codon:yes gene_type:complete